MFEINSDEKLRETFIRDLKFGSSFSGGKGRIRDFFKQDLTKLETIKLLKDEYGTGGKSTIAIGGYRQEHNVNGIKITLLTKEEKQYTWSDVYDALSTLIQAGEY